MITLRQIADSFIKDFEGGDKSKDSRLDHRDVIKKARIFSSRAVKADYFQKMNEGDKSAVTMCIATYENISLEETAYGQKFITIPEFYMTLPHAKGVHRLYVQGNPFQDFVLQHNPGISSNLPHMKLKDIQYCFIEGMKIKMGKGCNAKKADKLVLQLIVPAPDTVGENDPLPLSPEHVEEVMRLLKIDFAPVSVIPQDKLNNDNPNIR